MGNMGKHHKPRGRKQDSEKYTFYDSINVKLNMRQNYGLEVRIGYPWEKGVRTGEGHEGEGSGVLSVF